MKKNNCFNCKHHGEGTGADNNGWYHECLFNIQNDGLLDIEKCIKFEPNRGFSIGGYYTHMYFEKDGDQINWIIQGNGEFPKSLNDKDEWIKFNAIEFEQLEYFVEFWGKELRKKGLI